MKEKQKRFSASDISLMGWKVIISFILYVLWGFYALIDSKFLWVEDKNNSDWLPVYQAIKHYDLNDCEQFRFKKTSNSNADIQCRNSDKEAWIKKGNIKINVWE